MFNFQHTQLLVIDEIGKMEMLSKTFTSVISKLFNQNDRVIIATIPQAKGKPLNLVETISKQSDTSVIQVCYRGYLSDISSSYFSVQVKSGACYIMGEWGRVQNKIK